MANGNTFTSDIEMIRTSATTIKSLMEDIQTDLLNVDTIIGNIGNSWSGVNSNDFQTNLQDSKTDISNTVVIYDEIVNGMNKTADKIEQLQNFIGSKIANLGAISTTAAGALAGTFMNESNVNESVWNSDDVKFFDRGDGTVAAYKGEYKPENIIGFTTKDNISDSTSNEFVIEESDNLETIKAESILNDQFLINEKSIDTNLEKRINNTDVSNMKANGNSESNVFLEKNNNIIQEDVKIYKRDASNKIANKAREMGFTPEQVDIAVGISRFETGNYENIENNYNYGGVKMSGDGGKNPISGYGIWTNEDAGMDAFLNNLKKNYFDQGLNTPEEMSRKYLGYEDSGNWTKGVYGCMN